jgi:transcriptional regulator with XRE-family HTH domain
LVKNPYIDANLRRAKNPNMTIVEITGSMLRAARSLTGMTQQVVADRAGISRPCLTTWEGSSDSVPNAGVHVPRAHKENGFSLGQWVTYQRKNQDGLPVERRQALEKLGFVSSVSQL